ncbi:MAG: hypothetical protein D6753_03785 [Planctomycetota bacterium]|nr:MAG: hypothetical protein D6753_03785 [Planctomycetota bacterium]
MVGDSQDYTPVFRIDVSADQAPPVNASNSGEVMVALLHQIATTQRRQNELLEQLVNATVAAQKQRNTELQQWKEANPRLAQSCRRAAEALSKVHAEFLETLTQEVQENEECLMEGDFMLNEFVDRFGPRLAHLNGVLQVLAQLGSNAPSV